MKMSSKVDWVGSNREWWRLGTRKAYPPSKWAVVTQLQTVCPRGNEDSVGLHVLTF